MNNPFTNIVPTNKGADLDKSRALVQLGDYFRNNVNGYVYRLVRTGPQEVCLCGVSKLTLNKSGTAYNRPPVIVGNPNDLSIYDLDVIFSSGTWTKVCPTWEPCP